MRKVKPINPRSDQFHSRSDMKKISQNARQLYNPFNLFEFQVSRLGKINAFEQLVDELKMFNGELVKWKENKHNIPNVVTTFHLYENLCARLRYICYYSTQVNSAEEQVRRIRTWFFIEKPRIRCEVIEVKSNLKSQPLPQKVLRSSSMPADLLNEELQPYKKNLRTLHKGFYPPKESLKQFKRKEFIVLDSQQQKQKNMKKATSMSSIYQMKMSNYRNSITSVTRSTFKDTKDSFKNTGLQYQIEEVPKEQKPQEKQIEKQDSKEQIKEGQNIEKKEGEQKIGQQKPSQQEQVQNLQKNISQEIQENPEEQEQEEQQQEEKEQKKILKVYVSDHDVYDKMVAEDMGRVSYEASLRKFKKINEDKVRTKMDQISMKRNMVDWAKGSSQVKKLDSKKLQMLERCNKFQKLQHKIPSQKVFSSTNGFQKKEPKVITVLNRNKSSNAVSLEKDIQKARLRETMKNWGKYINHVGSNNFEPYSDFEQNNIKELRSTSLTAFADQGKKMSLETVLDENSPIEYNQRVQNQLIELKTSLAGKGVSIDKKRLFQSFSAVPTQQTVQIKKAQNIYKQSNNLLSNPFFPKHLYQTKKKK